MKNDREFLEGIYQKAEILQRKKLKKSNAYKSIMKFSSVAAILIILPLLMFNDQLQQPDSIAPPIHGPRTMNLIDPKANFFEAEYILIGTIEDSNESGVTVNVDNVFYGDISEDKIHLEPMEGVFSKNQRNLLFLNKDEGGMYYLIFGTESQFKEIKKDIFIDSNGDQYNFEDIKNNIDRRQ